MTRCRAKSLIPGRQLTTGDLLRRFSGLLVPGVPWKGLPEEFNDWHKSFQAECP
ncbi:hypothetical protein [Endozoicomonas sp. ISHI1]|uniref:hypothetical protein n=1 Tax=Endozoicomonas sp. ISHI1 TaxID=2825882 RepID=UPI0021477880|nr:hypothetical protein [Endozoicomonas sp. ISHI1]